MEDHKTLTLFYICLCVLLRVSKANEVSISSDTYMGHPVDIQIIVSSYRGNWPSKMTIVRKIWNLIHFILMQNTVEIIAKYAVDANLFRLGSTNPKKIHMFQKFVYIWTEISYIFLFKSVQIYMKYAECIETNEK